MAPRVAIITGCSSGIGLSTAVMLAKDPSKGYIVYATMRNLAKKGDLEEAAGDTLNKTLFITQLDVTVDDSIKRAVKEVFNKHQRIDILINNAAYGSLGYIELVTDQQMRRMFDTNYFGVVHLVQEVLPIMKKQRAGRILNISSVAGIKPWPFIEIYASTKFALEGFTESLALGYRPFNIWVSSVQPGPVKTAFVDNMGAPNNQSDYHQLREEKNIDKETRDVLDKMMKHFVGSPSFEKEQQTSEEIATIIKGALEAKEPHLRYPTSQFRYDFAKQYFTDPHGDDAVNSIVPHIIPDSLKK